MEQARKSNKEATAFTTPQPAVNHRYNLEEVLATGPDFYLFTGEAALALGVGVSTVRRWSDRGRLVCARNPRGVRFFRAGDVFALREERTGGHR
ncbi:helix-turn-helix domain-containing protein [Nocardiopsis tropica]|uniref:helix-turn-helix domain-containing protein n=1 Tax=Nocardiopsis tropica TaxID=109330 RepID=UPI002E89EAD1|nr:helix-turn-helix domain-containing protein [Nocardiopsis tropica]